MELNEAFKALKSRPVTGWTRKLVWRSVVGAIIGMLLGMMTSLILNVALVEISVSPFFALYFGILFLISGCVIAWRVIGSPLPDENARMSQKVMLVLSGMVCVSGVVCCVIQKSWFYALPKALKIPIYTLLGISIAFALIFSAIDLINVGFGLCTVTTSRSPVESPVQVSLITAVALLMGCIFGFMFGWLDVVNEISYHVRLSLLKEEQLCYPIGGALGALAGWANEYLRSQEEGYIALKRAQFDADI